MDIRARIIFLIVNTIDNSRQTVTSCIHQSVQLFSVKWCLNLFGIRTAHCRHAVCIYNTSLQEIRIFIRLHLVRHKIIIRKPCNLFYFIGSPHALEFQIMYRHNSLNPSIKFSTITEIVKIYRNQSSLPVMTVNDIWSEIYQR